MSIPNKRKRRRRGSPMPAFSLMSILSLQPLHALLGSIQRGEAFVANLAAAAHAGLQMLLGVAGDVARTDDAGTYVVGLVVLLFIALSYRNYIVKEGKAPYLTVIELLPEVRAFGALSGNSAYEKLAADLEQKQDENVTVGMIKEVKEEE